MASTKRSTQATNLVSPRRLVTWKAVFFVILVGLFMNLFLDTPLPDDMKEKWKVRLIDGSMRTFGFVEKTMIALGIIEPFSTFDKWLVDIFVITMTTGRPWIRTEDVGLKISNIHTDKNKIHLRMYEPTSSLHVQKRPVLIYFHGGGFSLLSVDSYDAVTRKLAKDSGIVVISVNYRLSPQYAYPIPLEDCLEAVTHVINNADELNIDSGRIAVGGDSAGGNLAASVSLRMKDKIKLQVLLVPALQMFTYNTTSVISSRNYFSNTVNNLLQVVFWTNYMGCGRDLIPDIITNKHTTPQLKQSKFGTYVDQNKWLKHRDVEFKNKDLAQKVDFGAPVTDSCLLNKMFDPEMCPLMADRELLSSGLPRAYVMTAGYDIIRDEGIMYAERLKDAGVPVTFINHKSSFHNALTFIGGPLCLDVGKKTIRDVISYLQLHV